MRITSNLKVGNNTQQYSKSYKSHPMRKHIKIVRGKPSNQSIVKLSSNGWIIADRQIINGQRYEEFHKDFKSDSNTNINPKLKRYVVGTSYLESIHNYLQFERQPWSSYLSKRNKTQKRSRQVSFYDKMIYGKSKRKFTRDKRRYGRKLKRYHRKMVDYDSKVDDWRKSHPKYTTKQLNHFIRKNHPRRPKNPFGKRPLKSMIITIGNSAKRRQIHNLVNDKYKEFPKSKRQQMLLKADLDYDLQAVRTFDKDLGPNATVISFTTNPDEIGKLQSNGKLSKTAGANHVHLTIAFKTFTNSKHNKPSCNFNNYLKARTNQSRPNQALKIFKDQVDRDVVKSTGNILRRAFPKVNQFQHFTLLRTGLGNGTNLLMSKYKSRKSLIDHYQQQIARLRHQHTIKDNRVIRSAKTHESNYKYHIKNSLGNKLTSSADNIASNTYSASASKAVTSKNISAENSAQNVVNNEWNDASNLVSSTTTKLNTSASNKIISNSIIASDNASVSASSVVSSIADSLNISADNKVSSLSTSLNTSATTDIASNSISADNSAQVIVDSNSASASTTSSEFTIEFQSVSSKASSVDSASSTLSSNQSIYDSKATNLGKAYSNWYNTRDYLKRETKHRESILDKLNQKIKVANQRVKAIKAKGVSIAKDITDKVVNNVKHPIRNIDKFGHDLKQDLINKWGFNQQKTITTNERVAKSRADSGIGVNSNSSASSTTSASDKTSHVSELSLNQSSSRSTSYNPYQYSSGIGGR